MGRHIDHGYQPPGIDQRQGSLHFWCFSPAASVIAQRKHGQLTESPFERAYCRGEMFPAGMTRLIKISLAFGRPSALAGSIPESEFLKSPVSAVADERTSIIATKMYFGLHSGDNTTYNVVNDQIRLAKTLFSQELNTPFFKKKLASNPRSCNSRTS